MTLGERLRELRHKTGLSQEQEAEQLGVSRQAVAKWEGDKSIPSMEKLLRLRALYQVSLEELTETPAPLNLSGEGEKTETKKGSRPPKRRLGALIAAVLAAAAVCLCIHMAPVDWDAGGCAGGYQSYIFQKYGQALTRRYVEGSEGSVASAQAVDGSQTAQWEGRTLYLRFRVRSVDAQTGTETEVPLTFIGKRMWTDTYHWGGAIIQG